MEKEKPPHIGAASLSQRAVDNKKPSRKILSLQYQTSDPVIHIKKDGPLFRVQILPPKKLDASITRPETYAGIIAARQAACWLSSATGFAVTDLTGMPS